MMRGGKSIKQYSSLSLNQPEHSMSFKVDQWKEKGSSVLIELVNFNLYLVISLVKFW